MTGRTPPLRQQGLTLVELMVVVAVMAVIAAIAYPLYVAQTQKARRADAKVALESVALAQERFYTLNGRFANTLSTLQLSAEIRGGDSDEGYYSIAAPVLANDDQEYSVTATAKADGAQGSDVGKCATLTIDHLGDKTSTGSASNCW